MGNNDRPAGAAKDQASDQQGQGQERPAQKQPETEPAQEWGERIDHGKAVQRGGHTSGDTPGAQGNS